MTKVSVTGISYKTDKSRYRAGIRILNTKTNTYTIIDVKTLQKVTTPCNYITEECSIGNIYFNFK